MADRVGRDLQERAESNVFGRSIISGLLIFLLLSLLSSNLPESALRGQITRIVQPVRNAFGLDQTWAVFAPDPRRESLGLEARIRYQDGAVVRWVMPSGDPVIAGYRTYHWRKYAEQVRLDSFQALWQPLAAWLARQHDEPARHPVEVTLIRRWRELGPAGATRPLKPWREFAFHTTGVTPQMLGAAR